MTTSISNITTSRKFELIEYELEGLKDFDMSFVDSVKRSFNKYGDITYRQSKALDNIIEQWAIVIEEDYEL